MSAESERIEEELRLAKEYWRQTIQPHIAGRRLRDVELYVAEHAHNVLQMAVQRALDWNDTDAGRLSPCSAELPAESHGEEFRAPEPLHADDLKPETLAMIAATLTNNRRTKQAPAEVFQTAHELLMAAEDYIKSLPKRGPARTRMGERFGLAFSTVTFAEIAASNGKDSGCLPLLPTIQKGRNEGQLSLVAFKRAVEQYLEQNTPQITEEEFKRDAEQTETLAAGGRLFRYGGGKPLNYHESQRNQQEYRNDCLQHGRIRVQDLCHMRWERFKRFWEQQQMRAAKRQSSAARKNVARPSEAAAPRQIRARKRQQ
jgi:hypothetical protein